MNQKEELNLEIAEELIENLVEVIQRDNKFYIISKSNDESREVYLDRTNYIIKKIDSVNNVDYNDIIRKSFIWRNINYYGMSYPSSITKKL